MLTELDEAIAQMLDAIIDGEGSLPILMVSVAINGSMIYTRFDQGADGIVAVSLAEHIVAGVLALPIHTMFVDGEGNAYRMGLTQQGVHLSS